MPLQPAYAWTETDSSIKITVDNVPIKHQSQLFCGDRVVKLNCPPYFLLLDLLHPVDDDRSSATIVKGRRVVINLVKAEPGPWHRLTPPKDADAATVKRQREESVQRAHNKLVAAQQQRQARKQQEERAAVDLQIQQQKAQRDQLEALKQQELQQERQELQHWQQRLPADAEGDESGYDDDNDLAVSADDAAQAAAGSSDGSSMQQQVSVQEEAAGSSQEELYHGKGWWPHNNNTNNSTSSNGQPGRSSSSGSSSSSAGSEDGQDEIITVSTNSNSSNSTHELVAAGLDTAPGCMLLNDGSASAAAMAQTPEQQQPFMSEASSRRLPGAENKQQQPQHSGVVSSSSSSTAASQQRPSKPVAPVRSRAAPVPVSFTQLETPHLPARQQREVEIKQIKRASAGHKSDSMTVADRQPAFLKDKGDAFAAQGNYRGAINAYSKALELDPLQAALWANRAAAHLALGQAAECVQDCTAAIRLVEQALSSSSALQGEVCAASEQELRKAGMLRAAAQPVMEPTPLAAAAGSAETSGTRAVAEADGSSGVAGADAGAAEAAGCNTVCEAAAPSDSSPAQAQHPAADQQQQHSDSVAQQLRQLLVKLLARRAAAHVELQQLQDAAEDLQCALRLDPNNLVLQADALEVSLALSSPGTGSSDPAAIKELAAARYKAWDLQGAAAVFTALVGLLQPQHGNSHEQQLQLAGALSNRAACWLGLNKFDDCVADCLAAFRVLCGADDDQRASAPPPAPPDTAAELLLQAHPPERLLQSASGRAAAQSGARIVARLAAAYACTKAAAAADAAFEWAAACWALLGEDARLAGIRADQQRLLRAGRVQ